jgi:hypothetical protein
MTSYAGDVLIPVDQPLLGRCGLCGQWVVYGIEGSLGSRRTRDGLILADVSRRGGAWLLLADGTYRRNGDRRRWATSGHRCRNPNPGWRQTLARIAYHKRRELRERLEQAAQR